MAYTVPGRDVGSWRALVYRYRGPAVGNGVRVLLLYLADHMNSHRYVSVPRQRIAHDLGVSESEVRTRLTAAHKAGLIDTVQRGQKGRTAVYQGLFSGYPGVSTERPRKGTGNRPPENGFSGYPGVPTSSKRNESEAPGLDSVGTHPSLSSSLSSENFNLPTSPDHEQTGVRAQNHGAYPTADQAHPLDHERYFSDSETTRPQTDDPEQTQARAPSRVATPPPAEPASAEAVGVVVADRATTWLHDSAVAFETRPTTDASRSGERCALCGRHEPHCRATAARHGNHLFTPST